MLVNEAVEVLVEEEEAWSDEGCVREAELTLGHVGNLWKKGNVRHSSQQP